MIKITKQTKVFPGLYTQVVVNPTELKYSGKCREFCIKEFFSENHEYFKSCLSTRMEECSENLIAAIKADEIIEVVYINENQVDILYKGGHFSQASYDLMAEALDASPEEMQHRVMNNKMFAIQLIKAVSAQHPVEHELILSVLLEGLLCSKQALRQT